ncbi:MAG: hypothetical protein K2N98_05760 [Lachnospiraceae bacterium]|nr:hypothetical protein [Lachnospiraceae bacterium]
MASTETINMGITSMETLPMEMFPAETISTAGPMVRISMETVRTAHMRHHPRRNIRD